MVEPHVIPTDEGVKRYMETGGYYTENGERIPCTCTSECEKPCKGKCGCRACHDAYQDFLSWE
jgi:hypothetical protein